MMTSWHRNIFLPTGPLWGVSSGFTLQMASNADIRCFLWCTLKYTVEQTAELPVIWEVITLICNEKPGYCPGSCIFRLQHRKKTFQISFIPGATTYCRKGFPVRVTVCYICGYFYTINNCCEKYNNYHYIIYVLWHCGNSMLCTFLFFVFIEQLTQNAKICRKWWYVDVQKWIHLRGRSIEVKLSLKW